MPTILPRRAAKRISRRRPDSPNRPRPATPILVASALAAGNVLTLTFDQPVLLAGVPRYTLVGFAAAPVSAVRTSPTVVAITYDDAIDGAALLDVGFRDPAVRNASGGYVTSTSVGF